MSFKMFSFCSFASLNAHTHACTPKKGLINLFDLCVIFDTKSDSLVLNALAFELSNEMKIGKKSHKLQPNLTKILIFRRNWRKCVLSIGFID